MLRRRTSSADRCSIRKIDINMANMQKGLSLLNNWADACNNRIISEIMYISTPSQLAGLLKASEFK